MPKLYDNVEYFTKEGRKYKNTYENIDSPRKSSYVPRERNRRCKSMTFFTRFGEKTSNIKNAFSKEELDSYSPPSYYLTNYNNDTNNINDKIFYYTSFPSIVECNKSNISTYDKIDKYLEDNKNFKLPPLNCLHLYDKKKNGRKINKIQLYRNEIPSTEDINIKKIDVEIENELRKNKKLQNERKYYECEEENLIDRKIMVNENKRIQSLDRQIDETLYIIDRNNSERKLQPPVSEFYCSKKKYKPSINRLVQMYN
uniref:Homeobox-containing protein n=1 Tax=Strongyloides papillosus TaxID=174720 RepID=A0A0N5C3Z8_STREA